MEKKLNNSVTGSQKEGFEISLIDIINFLSSAWKRLAIVAAVGALFGFGN
jgi:hypothetical protein